LEETVPDRESSNEEPLSDVTLFAEKVMKVHSLNFSRSAWLFFRLSPQENYQTMNPSDFRYCLKHCTETIIAKSFVLPILDQSNLLLQHLLDSILSPVHSINGYFYFNHDPSEDNQFVDQAIKFALKDKETKRSEQVGIDDDEDECSNTICESFCESIDGVDESDLSQAPSSFCESFEGINECDISPFGDDPPLFISLFLDGRPFSKKVLSRLCKNRSCQLTAGVTTFGQSVISRSDPAGIIQALPLLHAAVALSLRTKLASFTASQTLERLRHLGPALTSQELRVAMTCVFETNSVARAECRFGWHENSFWSHDDFLSALWRELTSGRFVKVKQASNRTEVLYITEDPQNKIDKTESLPYWAFLFFRTSHMSIYIHHPLGISEATDASTNISLIIHEACTRVNQLSLLEELHRNRTTNPLLISYSKTDCLEPVSKNEHINEKLVTEISLSQLLRHTSYTPGQYACPVVFRVDFPLNHRCQMNQTIMALESSVLHPFAVQNCPGLFCYKDESDAIFCLVLINSSRRVHQDEIDVKGGKILYDCIELLVMGVDSPGPSITVQLCRILRNKLETIALDALSKVLKKNPHYNLLPMDMMFVQHFEHKYESNESSSSSREVFVYDLPGICDDPYFFTLYFLRNICSCGFFHILHEADSSDERTGDISPEDPNETPMTDHFCARLDLDQSPVKFFYNNTPSPIDSKFSSTLTKRGQVLSKLTGRGIALLSLLLYRRDQNGEKSVVSNIRVGNVPIEMDTNLQALDKDNFCVKRAKKDDATRTSNFCIQLELFNTTVKVDVLMEWIELSMNQSLANWCIERHLFRSQRLLLKEDVSDRSKDTDVSSNINKICPGLQFLRGTLDLGNTFPSHIIHKKESCHRIRSTSIASLTYDLVKSCVKSIYNDSQVDVMQSDVNIIRYLQISENTKSRECHIPKPVALSTNSKTGMVRVSDLLSGEDIVDSRMESPVYLCVFGNLFNRECTALKNNYMEKNGISSTKCNNNSALHCQELIIDELDKGGAHQAFVQLKASGILLRRSAFVLLVSRTYRSFICYNWHPNTLKAFSYTELEEMHLARESNGWINEKIMLVGFNGNSSGFDKQHNGGANVPEPDDNDHSRDKENSRHEVKPSGNKITGKNSRIRPKLTIRRPKLIGSSSEGGAIQAVEASRARARAKKAPRPKRISLVHSASTKSLSDNFDPDHGKSSLVRDPSSTNGKNQNSAVSTSINSPSALNDKISGTSFPVELDIKSKAQNENENVSGIHHNKFSTPFSNVDQKNSELITSLIHLLSHKWSFSRSGYPMKPSDINTILSHAALVKVVSSKMIADLYQDSFSQSGFRATTFLDMYAYGLTEGEGGASVIPVHAEEKERKYVEIEGGSLECPSVYLRKILPNSKSGTVLIFKISAIRCHVLSTRIVEVRVFAINGIFVDKTRNSFRFQNSSENSIGKIKRRCIESTSQITDDVVDRLQLLRLNLEETVFNTVAYSLQNEASSRTQRPKDFVGIFKELSCRFPLKIQRTMKCLKFMLYKCEIRFSDLIGGDIDGIDSQEFLNYLCSRKIFSSGGIGQNQVLMGPVRGFEKVAMFFLMENNKNFDLFLLCRREGNILDRMVTKVDTNVSARLSEIIYLEAIRLIQETFFIGLQHWRCDLLWNNFVSDICPESMHELTILLRCSTVTKAFHKDLRLHSLLTEYQNLDFMWASILSSMKNDKESFSHVIKYSSDLSSSQYLIRARSFGLVFVLIEMDVHNSPYDVLIISQVDDKSVDKKCSDALDFIVTWVLRYIWSQLR